MPPDRIRVAIESLERTLNARMDRMETKLDRAIWDIERNKATHQSLRDRIEQIAKRTHGHATQITTLLAKAGIDGPESLKGNGYVTWPALSRIVVVAVGLVGFIELIRRLLTA